MSLIMIKNYWIGVCCKQFLRQYMHCEVLDTVLKFHVLDKVHEFTNLILFIYYKIRGKGDALDSGVNSLVRPTLDDSKIVYIDIYLKSLTIITIN